MLARIKCDQRRFPAPSSQELDWTWYTPALPCSARLIDLGPLLGPTKFPTVTRNGCPGFRGNAGKDFGSWNKRLQSDSAPWLLSEWLVLLLGNARNQPLYLVILICWICWVPTMHVLPGFGLLPWQQFSEIETHVKSLALLQSEVQNLQFDTKASSYQQQGL